MRGEGWKTLLETNKASQYAANVEGQQIKDLTHYHIVDFLALIQHFFTPLTRGRLKSRAVLLQIN